MHLLEPIFSVSFLNDKGDIVAALGQKLVVIRSDSYALLTAEEMAMLVTEHTRVQPQSLVAGSTQQSHVQLMSSASSKRLALARQPTLAQVPSMFPKHWCHPVVKLLIIELQHLRWRCMPNLCACTDGTDVCCAMSCLTSPGPISMSKLFVGCAYGCTASVLASLYRHHARSTLCHTL